MNQNEKTRIIILRGVPGSGKTTLAKKLEKELNWTRITADEHGLKAWKDPLKEAIERKDRFIILDRCHSSYNQRNNALKEIKPYKNQIITFLVTLPKLPFLELKERIIQDIGHRYAFDQRIMALKSHHKQMTYDKINKSIENWNYYINLETTSLSEFLEKMLRII